MKRSKNWLYFWLIILFLLLGFHFYDIYNTLNIRLFLDCIFHPPFKRIEFCYRQVVEWKNYRWRMDMPYPAVALLFLLPSWYFYRFLPSEGLYQLVFKLPFFLAYFLSIKLIKFYFGEKKRNNHLLFLINPLVMLAVFVAGSFDLIVAFLFLLAYLFFNKKTKYKYLSALTLGFVSAIRWYPIILLPLFLFHKEKRNNYNKLIFLLLFLFPLALNLLPFIIIPRYLAAFLKYGLPRNGPLGSWLLLAFINKSFLKIPNLLSKITPLFKVGILLTPFVVNKVFRNVRLGLKILAVLILFFIFSPTLHMFYLIPLLPWIYYYKVKSLYFIWAPMLYWALTSNGLPGLRGWHYFSYPVLEAYGEPLVNIFKDGGIFYIYNTFIVSLVVLIMLIRGIYELVRMRDSFKL